MAKKKITGQSKLVGASSPEKSSEKLKLVSRKTTIKPTSFRLNPDDKKRLKNLTAKVNMLSPHKKISETMIIKALLFKGQKMKPEGLIRAIREVLL